MMTYLLPFLVVMVGCISAYYIRLSGEFFRMTLTFSGAFLLSQVAFEMLPDIYAYGEDPKIMGLWVMLGVLLQIFLEFISKGIEHGHSHGLEKKDGFLFLGFVSVCIHAFLEGLSLTDMSLLTYGIAIHKFPISIALGVLLLKSNILRFWYFVAMLIFSLMTPLGSLLRHYVQGDWQLMASGISVGVLLHISTVILFESNKQHEFDKRIISVVMGFVFAYLIS